MTSADFKSRKQFYSWALYDWANSAFAVTVISGFFPIFFKQYLSAGTAATTSTFYLGLGNTAASFLVAVAAPFFGALADKGGLGKRFIAIFVTTGCTVCAGLFFVDKGQWPVAILLYVTCVICFSGANVFYDAMLVIVSPDRSRHRDSSIGYAMGYLGGGLLFLINVVMTLQPHWFGFENSQAAVRWSFVSVAVWWAVFSIPLLVFVQVDPNTTENRSFRALTGDAVSSLAATFKQVRVQKNVWLFLAAYWLYIDGVVTIIKMGVDFGISIGLPTNSLILALLIVQFVGFPSTLFFGRLAEKAPLRSLWIILTIYVVCTAYTYTLDTVTEFYGLAVILGLVQGAVQSISRSLFSQLIPADKAAQYFGFQNMVGKAAAVFGPALVGTIAYVTGDSRLGFLSILVLFIGGMLVLRLVRVPVTQPPEPRVSE